MSHIIVSTIGGIVDHGAVAALRQCLPGTVANLSAALMNGSPLFDEELFGAAEFDRFTRLRALVSILQSKGIELLIWEDGHPISAEILLNIMESFDETVARFEQTREPEHGA